MISTLQCNLRNPGFSKVQWPRRQQRAPHRFISSHLSFAKTTTTASLYGSITTTHEIFQIGQLDRARARAGM